MSIISIKNLSKKYGPKTVLDDVSLDINQGDIFGLLGSNGAGKSTLTKILLDFEKSTSGQISYYAGKPTNIKSKIAVVPQNIAAYLEFSVQENMEFFAALTSLNKNEQKERIDLLIKWLELKDFKNSKTMYLSGGYQRLLNIAISLLSNPEIIFLDEPTVGLDPKMRKMIWQKLKELQKDGKTLILTTHYMDEAEQLCSKIALLKKGKLIAKGTADDLIRQYGGENIFVISLDKDLTSAHFNLLKSVINLQIKYIDKKLAITFSQSYNFNNVINLLKKNLVDNKYEIVSANLKEPTLEDVFLNLTGEKTELVK